MIPTIGVGDPLFNPGWIQFNLQQCSGTAEVLELGPKKGTSWQLRTVIYRNKRGELFNPPCNPHMPIEFYSSNMRGGAYSRRMRLAVQELSEVYKNNGIRGGVNLSPVIQDVRPFLWKGMQVNPKYTYHIDMACYPENFDKNILNKARKAKGLGYTCEISNDFESIESCFERLDRKSRLRRFISSSALASLYDNLGSDGFVAFLCKDVQGIPVGVWIRLYTPGGMALAWLAGIKEDVLSDGVNNLLGEFAFKFFCDKGCTVFDYVGNDTQPVAEMREEWGGKLVCYYSVRERNVMNSAKEAYFATKSCVGRMFG